MRLFLVAMLALSSCGPAPRSETRDIADVARANSANALARIEELNTKVEALEHQLALTDASLEEARRNHDRLLETFNGNVEKGNRRDAAQEQDIDWLMNRNGVYRNR